MNIHYENEEEEFLVGSLRGKWDQTDLNQKKLPFGKEKTFRLSLDSDGKYTLHNGMKQNNLKWFGNCGQIQHKKQQRVSKTVEILQQSISSNEKQKDQQDQKIDEFLCHMPNHQKSSKSARYYLSENNWDLEKAITEYREDLGWEQQHYHKINNTTNAPPNNNPKIFQK